MHLVLGQIQETVTHVPYPQRGREEGRRVRGGGGGREGGEREGGREK